MLPAAHLRRRSRQEHHELGSTHSPASSPADSGYGTAPATPATPKKATERDRKSSIDIWVSCDGIQSDSDDPFIDSDSEQTFRGEVPASPVSPTTCIPPRNSDEKAVTLPKRPLRSRLTLPTSRSPFFKSTPQPQGPKTASVRHLDRFIPARATGTDASERFRTSKLPHNLTPAEKLLRHNGAAEDAFIYRRRVVTPLASEYRSPSGAESAASRNRVGSVLGPLDQNSIDGSDAQVSGNTAWTVGLGGTAVNNGRGQLVRSGTNAPLFRTTFPTVKAQNIEELEKHQARLAAALGLDRTQRVLETNAALSPGEICNKPGHVPTQWNGAEWVNEGPIPKPQRSLGNRELPTAPFKVLDAPNLRDDFYCSILAYCPTSQTLAVGLGDLLYGWSEARGVQLLNAGSDADCHLTSLSFSSSEGCKAILAFGRSNKTLSLMSLYDDPDPGTSRSAPTPRFEVVQPAPVACLSWRPVCTVRPSKSLMQPGIPVKTEDLLVGDEVGQVYYYSVEWPERWEVERHNWGGQMTLLARIVVHSQQICGLAWSRTGAAFGTGGNDNLCCLFETSKVLEAPPDKRDGDEGLLQGELSTTTHARAPSGVSEAETEVRVTQSTFVRHIRPGDEKHRWVHGAAVKAIAFCPWQESLVATGGGSNDKCIHFFHTGSGAALASISVSAQVTSLIWSTSRREIAATFGYAQPDHPVRIAVFSWPECRQVAAIPWAGEHRALYAIPFPCGPENTRSSGRGGGRTARRRSRTAEEGCIMVASSDKSVKFHEVWTADRKATAGGTGILGGSVILEFLEGIDRDETVIR